MNITIFDKPETKNKMIYASIITIGDELLIGQTIDTNSAQIARMLNKIGVWVRRRVAVGDVWDEIWRALDEESKQADIILITGGLGPTADDITKPLLCKYFNGKLVVNQEALANVKHIIEVMLKRPSLERNLKQAEVPDTCTVIQNKRGTAPGMWFEKDGKVFVSMPGVPYEMLGMMEDYVIPKLPYHFKLPHIAHRTLITAGIGESFLAERLVAFEAALPSNIKLAYLPNYGLVKLRLTVTDEDASVEKILDEQFGKLKSLLPDVMIADMDIEMHQLVAAMLKSKNKTLGLAESCTGGYIAHQLTAEPGASSYFMGSIVSYSNAVKHDLLSVDRNTLDMAGAVSENTVREMLAGALKALKTDYAIAVSGIMGPDGGSADKPVGTVWIAVGNKNKTEAKKFSFRFNRKKNIELTATNALNELRLFIQNNG